VAANGHGYVTDSKAGTVRVFDSRTLATLATVPAAADANAIVYDAPTGRVFAMNDDADTITVIDTGTDTPVATIELPGGEGLESAASDGQGHLFVAHSAGQDVLRIDTRRAVLDERFRLSGCPKPQGLALNVAAGRIYVSCESGLLVILDSRSGRQVASLPIGPGSETILFDAARHRIYAPSADSTLSVIDVGPADGYRLGKPVPTAPGARTAAEDPATGRVYFVGGAGELMSVVP
jgi:YVTN family beta-propeller protein